METKEVGIRELKSRLSAYLREVQAGSAFLVTDRGRVVAELRPYGGADRAAEPGAGYARDPFRGPPPEWASRQRELVARLKGFEGGSAPPGTAQALIDWEREDKS